MNYDFDVKQFGLLIHQKEKIESQLKLVKM